MKTHKFARKPFYVDAVRVSEANIEEVADWCDGEVFPKSPEGVETHIKVAVHRPLTDRQTQAFVGDWVLFAGTGYKVYTPKAFDKSFEKVKHLTKEQADEAGIKVPHEPRTPKNPVKNRQKVAPSSEAPAKKKPKFRPKPRPQNPVLSKEAASQIQFANEQAAKEAREKAEADKLLREVDKSR